MVRKTLAAACLAMLAAGPARAEDDMGTSGIPLSEEHYSERFLACMSADASNAELMACRDEETARWDGRLNAAYKAIMASGRLSAEGKAALKAAQKAWIATRDASCELPWHAAGQGSLGVGFSADCTVRETALRADLLEQMRASLGE